MIFDTKPLDDIEESDLQALLAKPVPERKRIEKSFWLMFPHSQIRWADIFFME